jgi:hypothetical protein
MTALPNLREHAARSGGVRCGCSGQPRLRADASRTGVLASEAERDERPTILYGLSAGGMLAYSRRSGWTDGLGQRVT